MTACENNLIMQCQSIEHKDHILLILSNGIYLFQSFIILNGTKLECYGTDSDIFLENVILDLHDDPIFISLYFYTHELPPLEFCKKISFEYNVNIELVYFNKENNYSGKVRIKDKRVCCNEIISYYQGLYTYEQDMFWENIEDSFEGEYNWDLLYGKLNISILSMDLEKVKSLFNEHLLLKQFQNL